MNEFLKSILDGINLLINNYGWSMIIFTVLIKLVLMPFDYKSRVSMRRMQKLNPQVQALQKKYANDKEKLNQKTAELYKKEKINPLSSCLPMLLTFPILIAMFNAMRMIANEQLVKQVFDILQGNEPVMEGWLWVRNLWMPDSPTSPAWPDLNILKMIPVETWQSMWATMGETVVNLPETLVLTAESFTNDNLNGTIESIYAAMAAMPGYADAVALLPGWSINLLITKFDLCRNFNGLFILPVVSAVSQYFMSQAMGTNQPTTTTGPNGPQTTGGFMKWFFPAFSLFICASSTASFSLYWVTSNLFSVVQTWGINKYLDMKEKKAAEAKETVK